MWKIFSIPGACTNRKVGYYFECFQHHIHLYVLGSSYLFQQPPPQHHRKVQHYCDHHLHYILATHQCFFFLENVNTIDSSLVCAQWTYMLALQLLWPSNRDNISVQMQPSAGIYWVSTCHFVSGSNTCDTSPWIWWKPLDCGWPALGQL